MKMENNPTIKEAQAAKKCLQKDIAFLIDRFHNKFENKIKVEQIKVIVNEFPTHCETLTVTETEIKIVL